MDPLPEVRDLSIEDLQGLGFPEHAYVRPVVHQGRPSYAICAADGSLLAVAPTREAAFGIIRQHDMEPLDAH